MAKISRPLIYGGVGLIAIVALYLNNEPESDSSSQATRRPASSRGSNDASEQFGPEDYDTVFERLNESANNAFNPLVMRIGSGGSSGGLMPNELPASFAGGESGWAYTGTIEIDGVQSALLENDMTGDGMFLKVGEKLKKTTITKIAPTYIVLEASTGRTVQLDLLRDLPDPDDFYDGMEIEPVRPNVGDTMSGPFRGLEEN